MPSATWQTQRDESSPLTTWLLNNVSEAAKPILGSPRTVDIVHESLVHDWDLLRTWLAESRSVMRLQRRLESSAQEWDQRHRPTGSEYLLGGTQLQETLAFLQLHRDELSGLAQDFIAASRKSQNRLRLRTSMLIPLALLAGMAASIVSRFILPHPSQPPATPEVEATTPANLPQAGSEAQPSGVWQRRSTAAPPQLNTPTTDTPEPSATIPYTPQDTEIEYVMVPGGKMASPENPNELIDFWVRVRKDSRVPEAITVKEEATPAGVGSQN